jgi:drug/metabolite transporter (DMT)-like permease
MMNYHDPRIKGIIFTLITTFIWGFQAIVIKLATNLVDATAIAWFRFALAFSLLFVFYAVKKPSCLKILKKPPLYLVVAAFGLTINYLAFNYGIKYTSPNIAVLVIQIGPISLGLTGFFFFNEKISYRQAFGFILAGAGMTMFYLENLIQVSGDTSLYSWGVLLVVISALGWTVFAAFQKILTKTYPTGQLNLFVFGLPALLLAPFIRFDAFTSLSPLAWGLLIYLGLNTLIAYGFLALALKYLDASKVSVMITINPIITIVTMGILTYLEVSWIEPEIFTFKIIGTALIVLCGAVMAVALSKPENRRDVRSFFGRKKK